MELTKWKKQFGSVIYHTCWLGGRRVKISDVDSVLNVVVDCDNQRGAVTNGVFEMLSPTHSNVVCHEEKLSLTGNKRNTPTTQFYEVNLPWS